MSIDKIIQSIRSNKQNHLVNFQLKSKTDEFCDELFHVLFDSTISVSENMDNLATTFYEITELLQEYQSCNLDSIWKKFLVKLPEMLSELNKDATCIFDHDPAASSVEEVILAYPGFFAISLYRLSHELHVLNMPLVPRMMSEYAHRLTELTSIPALRSAHPFLSTMEQAWLLAKVPS